MTKRELRKEGANKRDAASTFRGPEKPCKTCKYHVNKPSYCRNLREFVGRNHTCGGHRE